MITQNEYMRRMKEMAAMQPGMSFYGDLPESYNITVNTQQKAVEEIMKNAETELAGKVQPLADQMEEKNKAIEQLRANAKDGKLSDEQQAESSKLENEVDVLRKEQEKLISDYAATQPKIKQLIDLALLGNGLLKGAQLSQFISRSVDLLS